VNRVAHLLKHGSLTCETTFARDDQGRLVHRCVLCGSDVPVLGSAVVRGPKVVADPVLGQPRTKVMRYELETPENVTRFERKGAR